MAGIVVLKRTCSYHDENNESVEVTFFRIANGNGDDLEEDIYLVMVVTSLWSLW